MKTAWSETESQQFWNNARVLELLKMDLRAQQQNLQKEHVNLKSTSFMIYQMKKSFLQPSLYPHLLNPPNSKARHVQTENLLRKEIQSLENCANELNCINLKIQLMINQMNSLQFLTVQHHSWEISIIKQAIDEIIPDEGLAGPTVVGVIPDEERDVQKEIENSETQHERIVREWGFNFNDTPFPRKRNLYHVIYTDEHVDYIYNDLSDPQILGWASHVKCKNGNVGRFSGRIHTHDLVAVVNPYEARMRVYDKDSW